MKNAVLLFFLCLLLSPKIFANQNITPDDFPACPAGTLKTDVPIPSRQQRLIFCYKLDSSDKDMRINHGPFWRFDLQENLTERLWYIEGKIGENSPVLPTLENDKKLAETPTHDLSFMRSVVHEIFMRFLPVARQHRGPVAVGGFETRDCLTNNSGLLNFLRGDRPSFAFDFRFHRGRCSLQGHHNMQLNRPHQVKLEVNDLRDYRQLEFLLLVSPTIIDPQTTEISLRISQGLLRNPHGGIKFGAEYLLKIDAQGRTWDDHQGLLKLTEFRGEKIDQTIPLKAPIILVP